jgi:hypothetical protein
MSESALCPSQSRYIRVNRPRGLLWTRGGNPSRRMAGPGMARWERPYRTTRIMCPRVRISDFGSSTVGNITRTRCATLSQSLSPQATMPFLRRARPPTCPCVRRTVFRFKFSSAARVYLPALPRVDSDVTQTPGLGDAAHSAACPLEDWFSGIGKAITFSLVTRLDPW